MLPSLGFQEIVLLGILALVVVGPKDLPLLLRKLGRWTAKLRAMAQEFRTGFDELARQAELDELKKEVDALRRNQVLTDISNEVHKPLDAPLTQTLPAPHDVAHGAADEAPASSSMEEVAAPQSGEAGGGAPATTTTESSEARSLASRSSPPQSVARATDSSSIEEERGEVARTAP